jgi:hypothetical protein
MLACSRWKITRMLLVYLLSLTIEALAMIFLFPILKEEPVRWICIIISILKCVVIFFLFVGSLLTNEKIFDFAIKSHQIHSVLTPIVGAIAWPLRMFLAEAFAMGFEQMFLFMYFFFTVFLNIGTYKGNKLARIEIGYLERDKLLKNETRQETKKTPLIQPKSESKSTPMIETSHKPVQSTPMIYTSYEPVQGTPMIQTSHEPVQGTAAVYEPLTIENSQPLQQAGNDVVNDHTNLSVNEKGCYKNDF